MRYKDLPVEDKFVILERWVNYNIEAKVNQIIRKKQYCIYESVELFFKSVCYDYQFGSHAHALLHAKKCYYCNRIMSSEVVDSHPSRRTVDHFIPRSLMPGKKNKKVVCCRRCNSAKGWLHPWELIRRLELNINKPGFPIKMECVPRIMKILDDLENNEGPSYYYLL